MSSGEKIRFALMCKSTELQHWQVSALTELLYDPEFELCLIILDKSHYPVPSLLDKLSNNLLYNQYERRFLKPLARSRFTLNHEQIKNVPTIACEAIPVGKYAQKLTAEDVEKIKSYQLDFIIRSGFNILKGDILHAAKWGIWSYHHGEPEEFRGGPPGFWEILNGRKTNGAILQRLTEKLDAGIILHRGTFPVAKHSYAETIDNFLSGSKSWIKTAALNCKYGNLDPETGLGPLAKLGPVYKRPSNFTFLRFLLRLLSNRIHFYYCKYFVREMWSSGITNMPAAELLNHQTITAGSWVPNKEANTYLADPFIDTSDKNPQLFLEKFDYRTKKAYIVSSDFDSEKAQFSEIKTALKTDHHLSYPSVYTDNSDKYLAPESWGSGKLELYKIKHGELTEPSTILHKGAIDPTLLKHNGKYWLFCTFRSAPSHQLYIFHADEITGPYTPHILNPVKSDVRNSRPAGGFFTIDGQLYRPAQNCSLTYGGSVVINKIIELTETSFKEETVNEVFADKSWKHNLGLHTINISGNWIVFDAKRNEFHFNPKGN